MEIVCLNSNGFPSNRMHSLKMYYLNKIIKERDIAVILETGINKNGKMKDVTEDHDITKINYMKDIENEQYQHNGNGTAIITR